MLTCLKLLGLADFHIKENTKIQHNMKVFYVYFVS